MAESTLFLDLVEPLIDFLDLTDGIESIDLLPRSDFFDLERTDLLLLSHDLTDFNIFLLLKTLDIFLGSTLFPNEEPNLRLLLLAFFKTLLVGFIVRAEG